MKTIKLFSIILLSAITLTSLAFAGDGWMTNYEAAKAKAKSENKPMLIDFTGSSWCPPCIRLEAEVFSQEIFKEYAKDALVLLELDFPRDWRNSKDEAVTRNVELFNKYQIQGFPTLVLLTPKGELVGYAGYAKVGAESYVETFKQAISEFSSEPSL